jgi:hypothetical protein
MRTVITLAAALSLAGCLQGQSQAAQSYEIAMCPEPLRLSDCKFEGAGPYCTFENTAQRALSGYPRAWGYNKEGVQLTNYAITDIDGMHPGQKKRAALVLGTEFQKVSKVVVCSMDPQNPIVKGQITSVGVAR